MKLQKVLYVLFMVGSLWAMKSSCGGPYYRQAMADACVEEIPGSNIFLKEPCEPTAMYLNGRVYPLPIQYYTSAAAYALYPQIEEARFFMCDKLGNEIEYVPYKDALLRMRVNKLSDHYK